MGGSYLPIRGTGKNGQKSVNVWPLVKLSKFVGNKNYILL